MNRLHAFVIVLPLALSGCGAIGAGAPVVLSDIAVAACAAQQAANVAEKIAESAGNAAWAARFAEASRLAGLGCAW